MRTENSLGTQGISTSEGTVILPPEYDHINTPIDGKVIVKQGDDYGLYDLNQKKFIIPLGKYYWLSEIHPKSGFIRCIEESIINDKRTRRMGILAIDGQVVLPAIAYRIWDFIHNEDDDVRMEWGDYSQEISIEEIMDVYEKKFSVDTVEKLCNRSFRYYDTDMWPKEDIFMHIDKESLEDEEVEVPEDVYEYEEVYYAPEIDEEDYEYDEESYEEYIDYDPDQWDGDYEAYLEEYGE